MPWQDSPHTTNSPLRIDKNGDTILDTTIGARHDAEEIEKASKTIQDLLKKYKPTVQAPPKPQPSTPPSEPEPKPEAEPEKAPEPKPAQGATGLLNLECPECGRVFSTFQKEPANTVQCNCGHDIEVDRDRLARFEYDCPYCEKHKWGLTNREDPEIEIQCSCKSRVTLTWNSKERVYVN